MAFVASDRVWAVVVLALVVLALVVLALDNGYKNYFVYFEMD